MVRAGRKNPNAVGVLSYGENGPIVSMNFLPQGQAGFVFHVFGSKERIHYENRFDPNPYLSGIKKFLRMFRTGKEPFTPREILAPIAVLEALDQSFKAGKKVSVRKIPEI